MLFSLGLWLLAAGVIAYLLRVIYRLTLDPLSKFPGPGGASSLWAISVDCNPSRSVVKLLPDLHQKYGPIVRVRPDELHIHDFGAYSTVFKAGSRFNRRKDFYNNPIADGSILNIEDVRDAKPHKDLFLPHFSKKVVDELQPLFHEKLELFFTRLEGMAVRDAVVKLDRAFLCLNADTVMHWTYQQGLGALDAPDFEFDLVEAVESGAKIIPSLWYFPNLGAWLFWFIGILPLDWKQSFFPEVAALHGMEAQCRSRVTALFNSPPETTAGPESIFATAMRQKESQKGYQLSLREMTGDAVLMFLAGTDTTANALTYGTWYTLTNPEILRKLRAELDEAMPDITALYPQMHLERLPYLRALIKESLRFSYGTSARLMRVVPPEGAELCGQHIPGGTTVSFANPIYNHDPAIFTPDPYIFRPERWIPSAAVTAADVSLLESRMVSFSRGSRNCLGQNVALAELYNTFAHLFRRFDLSVEGTTAEEMEWTDAFTPQRKGHLKVNVVKRSGRTGA